MNLTIADSYILLVSIFSSGKDDLVSHLMHGYDLAIHFCKMLPTRLGICQLLVGHNHGEAETRRVSIVNPQH